MDEMIRVEGLKKHFGEVRAVDGIHFSVEKGELFGFLGINGAGKSTTINMLCTLLAPTAGHVKICGYELGREDGEIRKRIGVVWQHNCLDDRLTVKENLYVRGSLYGFCARELKSRVDHICERLHLEDIFTAAYKRLSGGQKRRCEIAAALINTPELLFLDEPTTGLDPATRQFVWESMETLQKESDTTIFLTTHYMEEAANAKHIAIIDHGQILEYGTPFSLKEQYARDKLYLIPQSGREAELMQILENVRLHENIHFHEDRETREAGQMHAEKQQKAGQMHAGRGDAGSVAANVTHMGDRLILTVWDSMAALEILQAVRHCISGFEMIQGSLDDVFLNVTGKSLDGQ